MGKTYRKGFGTKNRRQRGYKQGGKARKRTSNCRHPSIKKSRK